MVTFLGTLVIFALILVVITFFHENYPHIKLERKQKRERKEMERLFSSGNWKFPSKAFYLKCRKMNLSPSEDEFTTKKLMSVALLFIDDSLKKSQWFGMYYTEEKVRAYFFEGKAIIDEEYRKARERNKIEKRTVFKGALSEEAEREADLAKKMKDLYGIDKRILWLSNLSFDLTLRIGKLEAARQASYMAAAMLQTSAYQEKETDWAVHGGIASGIAGPAAGIAVASQIMAENEQIRARNAQNRAAVDKLASEIVASTKSISTRDLEKQQKALEKELEQVRYKVVLDEWVGIWESLKIEHDVKLCDAKVGDIETHYTKVNFKISSNYKPKCPQNTDFIIDGTFWARLYCDDNYMGDVCVPLPLYGVDCNNGNTVETVGYFHKYMTKQKRTYRIELAPNRLWVMEK